MILRGLALMGNKVELLDVRSPLERNLKGYDLMIHYGELDHVEQHLAVARRSRVTVLVNSTFDGRGDRAHWMTEQVKRWNSKRGSNVKLIVFSEAAKDDPRLRPISSRLVVMPKTIRVHDDPMIPWKSRSGICIGEMAKLNRSKLTGGLDLPKTIRAIREAAPGLPIYTYNQYAPLGTPLPKHVIEVSYDENGFMAWLSKLRIYASLTQWETFSMVPIEAQLMGTPVLSRVMHQSLAEYLGPTAWSWRTIEELSLLIRLIYSKEPSWAKISQAGKLNAKARSVEYIAPLLDASVRKALIEGAG
jgi:hypothetical protein